MWIRGRDVDKGLGKLGTVLDIDIEEGGGVGYHLQRTSSLLTAAAWAMVRTPARAKKVFSCILKG